ncbi:MAG: aminopeptidase P family protein [Nitrososphaerota archaeon]|nr:aminopeptidase P family protein [Nitrososphaerota archaeon]
MTPSYRSQVPYDWKTRRMYQDLPFPVSEYASRVKRMKAAMQTADLDAILVFGSAGDPGDVVYLSNFIPFSGNAAVFLPVDGEPTIITDAVLHGEPINSFAWMTWMEDFLPVHRSPGEFASAIKSVLKRKPHARVGLVGRDIVSMSVWSEMDGLGTEWKDFWFEFTSVKSIRSPREISLLREVGRITASAMSSAVERTKTGITESEVAAVATGALLREGAHDRAFGTIVSSGPRSGIKHSYPTGRRLRRGDMVYLDMGAAKYGYQSDMSRTVVVGGASNEQRRVLDTVQEAFDTLSGMMRPGTRTSELMAKAEEIAGRSGLRERYEGRIYLGLYVHHAIATSFFEIPSLGLPDTVLRKNMTFAFEPMAHILDFGTAVIEDCLLVTRSGAESLTPYERVHW